MRTTRSLVWIRRTLLAKAFATLLLALTITPFTAPFATLDAAELVTEAGHALDATAKPVKDVATAVLPPAPLFVAILRPVARDSRATAPIDLQRLRTIVLRL